MHCSACCSGHLAPPFLALLDRARAAFGKLGWSPPWTLALGGLIVGLISVGVPRVWGNGFSVVNDMLNDRLPLDLLALVLVAKLVSTAATVGSGAQGGILTPTLFMGAALGAIFGNALHLIDPHSLSQPAAYAVVGMGGFLAATTHAPLTSILLIFEMTLDYEVVLPLMLACVTGHYVARIYRGGRVGLYAFAEGQGTRGCGGVASAADRCADASAGGATAAGSAAARSARAGHARGGGRAYVVDAENQLVGQYDLSALVRQPGAELLPENYTVGRRWSRRRRC